MPGREQSQASTASRCPGVSALGLHCHHQPEASWAPAPPLPPLPEPGDQPLSQPAPSPAGPSGAHAPEGGTVILRGPFENELLTVNLLRFLWF